MSCLITVVGLVLLCIARLPNAHAISEDKCGFYKMEHDASKHPAGKRLVNHGVSNSTVGHHLLCFYRCTKNCLCESFNVCGQRCELSSSTKESSANDYETEAECTYYDMARVSRSVYPRVQETCNGSPKKFCCRTHNPCLNGGECIGFCPDLGKRFECKCKTGFCGDRCESRVSTCQEFWTNRKPTNGMYTVFDENNATLEVFCDFNSEEGMAWTLFTSSDVDLNVKPHLLEFSPWNANQATINWARYRLPKPTVVHLSTKSTHWRLTCEYDKMEVDYVDYLRSKLNETNPVTWDHTTVPIAERCRKVEYVDIRGRQCTDCTLFIGQGGSCGMYVREPTNSVYGCDFDSSKFLSDCPEGHVSEFYFNCQRHMSCNSGKHRCNKVKESTSQFWFGG